MYGGVVIGQLQQMATDTLTGTMQMTNANDTPRHMNVVHVVESCAAVSISFLCNFPIIAQLHPIMINNECGGDEFTR